MKASYVESPYEKIMAHWAASYYQDHSIRVARWLGISATPIERIMGEALSVIHTVAIDCFNDYDRLIYLAGSDFETDTYLWKISQQASIGKYKADFLVECSLCPDKPLVVECDGHDFHEKTKAQAAHDKRRDRFMAVNGFGLLRFTGSEIYKDPISCVRDVVDYFEQFTTESALFERAEEIWMGR